MMRLIVRASVLRRKVLVFFVVDDVKEDRWNAPPGVSGPPLPSAGAAVLGREAICRRSCLACTFLVSLKVCKRPHPSKLLLLLCLF